MTPFHPFPIPYEGNRELQDEAAAEQDAGQCSECDGDGWNWVQEAVTHQLGTDMHTVRGDCPTCNGTGRAA